MTKPSLSERLFDQELAESWHSQAMSAFERYLKENPDIDVIAAERKKQIFIDGFVAASRVPAQSEIALTECIPMDPNGIIELSRRLLPYLMGFGRYSSVAPGDMMAALLICLTTIGRQLHPTLNNQKVFEIFGNEASIILRALDRLQSSQGQSVQ